jgi:N-acetyl-1-D-myo-inositol-2-amino-2-deoxy-alpha-D-glucopyranoside deacetylase
MGPLLALFPHPDDETFSAAGVMAAAVERGVPVTVITATRGEAGESSIAGLDDPERLGVVRERELREAMRQIGVSDVRWLGYRDSGMAGSPSAEHPQAFIRVPVETAAATLVPHIRSLQPQVIITFGAEGLYGHPDHLHMHHVALRAIQLAADPAHKDRATAQPWQTPALYFAAFPREEMLTLFDRPDSPLRSLPEDARANLGTPRSEITHTISIEPWRESKRAAIAAHRTQTAEGGPLAGIAPEVREWQLSWEYFVRAPLPWSSPQDDASDIIAVLASEHDLG